MQKTDCPDCGNSVSSPFLSETRELICPQCGRSFSVRNIYISAGPYIFYRDAVMDKTDKYVHLLKTIQDEANSMEEKGRDSLPLRETAKTLNVFVAMLKEVLDGCRERPRLPGGRTSLECSLDDTVFSVKLMNISSTGLCLHREDSEERLRPGRIINLKIEDRSLPNPLCLKGWVVWSTEKGVTGMKFVGLDEGLKDKLAGLIAAKSSEEKGPCNA